MIWARSSFTSVVLVKPFSEALFEVEVMYSACSQLWLVVRQLKANVNVHLSSGFKSYVINMDCMFI